MTWNAHSALACAVLLYVATSAPIPSRAADKSPTLPSTDLPKLPDSLGAGKTPNNLSPDQLRDRYEVDRKCESALSMAKGGNFERAVPLATEAVTIGLASQVIDEDAEIGLYTLIGMMEAKRGQYDESLRWLNRALALIEKRHDRKSLPRCTTLEYLATVHFLTKKYPEACALLDESTALRRELQEPLHADLIRPLHLSAVIAVEREDYDTAAKFQSEVVDAAAKAHGFDSQEYGLHAANLGQIQRAEGDQPAARAAFEKALAAYEIVYGVDDKRTTDVGKELADVIQRIDEGDFPLIPDQRRRLELATELNERSKKLQSEKNLEAALPLSRQAAEIVRDVRGTRHADTAAMITNLGDIEARLGQTERAVATLGEALEIQESLQHPRRDELITTAWKLGRQELILGRDATARKHLTLSIDEARQLGAKFDNVRVRTQIPLVDIEGRAKNYAEIVRIADEARQLYRSGTTVKPGSIGGLLDVAGLYLAKEPTWRERAVHDLVEATQIAEKEFGASSKDLGVALFYEAAGRYHCEDRACIDLFRRAATVFGERDGDLSPIAIYGRYCQAASCMVFDDLPQAKSLLDNELRLLRSAARPDDESLSSALVLLACVESHQGDVAAAKACYREAIDIRTRIPDFEAERLARTKKMLEDLQAGKPCGRTASDWPLDFTISLPE